MRPSLKVSNPVITFVSGSSLANKRAQELFASLFSFHEISLPSVEDNDKKSSDKLNLYEDTLSQCLSTYPSILSTTPTSKAIECPSSGTILHFLSIEKNQPKSDDWLISGFGNNNEMTAQIDNDHNLSLLAITDTAKGKSKMESIHIAREHIAQYVSKATSLKLGIYDIMKQPITSIDILGKSECIPLIQIETNLSKSKSKLNTTSTTIHGMHCSSFIREIVIPYRENDDGDKYGNQNGLLSKLNTRFLNRPYDPMTKKPVVGLYQWPHSSCTHSHSTNKVDINKYSNETNDIYSTSLYLRPLPEAKEDRILPPPSLVIQCPNLKEMEKTMQEIHHQHLLTNDSNKTKADALTFAKVGFTGAVSSANHTGQLIVRHDDFMGLDIRLCENIRLSSSFAEAQDALLAGSLEELQNPNVLSEGRKSQDGINSKSESNNIATKSVIGDCWMEFRANVRQPSGFFSKGST